jgi:hypothetical protein
MKRHGCARSRREWPKPLMLVLNHSIHFLFIIKVTVTGSPFHLKDRIQSIWRHESAAFRCINVDVVVGCLCFYLDFIASNCHFVAAEGRVGSLFASCSLLQSTSILI